MSKFQNQPVFAVTLLPSFLPLQSVSFHKNSEHLEWVLRVAICRSYYCQLPQIAPLVFPATGQGLVTAGFFPDESLVLPVIYCSLVQQDLCQTPLRGDPI